MSSPQLPQLEPGVGGRDYPKVVSDRTAIPPSVRETLSIPPFRRLWLVLGLASLGDWAGLLAITAYANALAGAGYADRNFAIAGVLLVRVLPALLIGPLGGYAADRLPRRTTLVTGLALRAALFVSIPLVGTLTWLLIATVLVEAVNLVWLPTKDALVPDLVPRNHLENASRLNLTTTYGAALPAAGLFIAVTVATEALNSTLGWFTAAPLDPVLYVTAGAFAFAGLVCHGLHLPTRAAGRSVQTGVWRSIAEGWSYAGRTPLVRGLVIGVVGAFAAGGVVIGLGRVYVADLGAGDPGYGVLFGAVFLGLGAGMWRGPRVLLGVSRRRLFCLALVAAGLALALVALVGNMVVAALLTVGLGYCAGIAWVTGYTLIGLEVDEAVRGRTFAFLQSLVRLTLALVLAIAPLIAGLIGAHRFRVNDDVSLTYSGAQFTFLLAAVVIAVVGAGAYRQMDDRPGESLRDQLGHPTRTPGEAPRRYAATGLFVALEGGEGAGKTTQARLLAVWLRDRGHEVVLTHEPGDTSVGSTLRSLLLDPSTGVLAHRTETLLYAADKAEHVERVIEPALARGAVVITDRYVDSTLAYQGAGRDLTREEVERVARWATGGLRPHLTVLLDIDVATGVARAGTPDRLEAEPAVFHNRVRASFLEIAGGDPEHYLVLDSGSDPDAIAASIRTRLEPLLQLSRTVADAGTREAP